MQRYKRSILILVIAAVAIGVLIMRTLPTTAHRVTIPRPTSYPFEEARTIAEEHLPKFMDTISRNNQSVQFGFKDAEETRRATLGIPYLSYGFDLLHIPERVAPNEHLRDRLEGGTEIGFPVLVDGEARAYMSVVYRDGIWRDGEWSGYAPTAMVELQKRLAAQGITERVDYVGFDTYGTRFGMIDQQGQTFLIPLADPMHFFPELDWSGNQMYTLGEVLPLLHVQAQRIVADLQRQHEENLRRQPNPPPTALPGPTSEPPTRAPAYPLPALTATAVTVP